jgi:hypothetical protein
MCSVSPQVHARRRGQTIHCGSQAAEAGAVQVSTCKQSAAHLATAGLLQVQLSGLCVCLGFSEQQLRHTTVMMLCV